MRLTRKWRLTYTAKAEEIVRGMSLEEKIALMSGNTSLQKVNDDKQAGFHFGYRPFPAGGNEKLGIPAVMFADGPRGVVCGYKMATCFPVPMLRGASFDVNLEEKIGAAIGRELKAFGSNLFGGVCINLLYHPGWGRSQETYGEDSLAVGKMGAAMVRGVQSEQVMACLKHYAFNSIENSRFEVNIDCSRRAEREVFLAHFKDCIDAGAAAVMAGYNSYQGVRCGHSPYLMRRILKEEWKFDGFVLSDFFWGISDTEAAVKGGLDMEMCHTKYYGKRLVDAVKEGRAAERDIDEAAVRIVRTTLAFEDARKKYETRKKQTPGCSAHRKLALQSAQEGITLIKNENGVLPFQKKMRKIAVIGRLAVQENTGDHGSSRVYPSHVVTLLEGIAGAVTETEVIYYEGDDTAHVRHLAETSDAVILAAGLNYRDEGEYNPMKEAGMFRIERIGDRNSLRLCPQSVRMILAAGESNPNTAVVLMGGSAITVTEWESAVSAIMFVYYPGQEGGSAIAQILFGEISPSGKLPFVLPGDEKDLPAMDWNAKKQTYHDYHGYQYLDKMGIRPFRPFGFGMSYTTFAVRDAQAVVKGKNLAVSVLLKNTGDRRGAEVLQVYAGFSGSKVDRPVRKLWGFKRVDLKPGQEKKVIISCPLQKLEYYHEERQCFELEHMEYEVYVGTSGGEEDLQLLSVEL